MEVHADTHTGAGSDEFKILSIDGGGIKGLFAACVLDAIEQANGRLTDHFDMLCGTSTGGLIALGLAAGSSAADLVRLYQEHGPRIFPAGGRLARWTRQYGFYLGQGKYSDRALRAALDEIIGMRRMRDANSYLCIPAIALVTSSPMLFKTDHNQELTRDGNTLMRDVALATSAAPFYLPVAHAADALGGQFVDGGLWANNPAFLGLVEAFRFFVGPGKPYRRVRILSIPTPTAPVGRVVRRHRGLAAARDSREIIEVALDVQQKSVHHAINLLLPALCAPVVYTRIPSPALTPEQACHITLDCATPEAIETLRHLGVATGHSWNKKPEITTCFAHPAAAPHLATN